MEPSESDNVRWHVLKSAQALRQAAYRCILNAAAHAIDVRGQFLIVLSGGNTPRGIYTMLRYADTDWSRWQVYFSDERCLSVHETERNSAMAGAVWLNHVSIPQDHVHVIPAELGARAAALVCEKTLRGIGEFDLVLLGLGEDGHTASLFPGDDWGVAPDAPDALAVYDAPKPPSQRVSLSAARLSRARAALFLVHGESKRNAVAQWRMGAHIPARAIHPHAGVDVLVEARLLSSIEAA
ncbi:MAG TPA: 6-phosphogluconolactonase [Pusillimonas sp.]|nr:6-phosphogluconolactonase [Pusillimonas sp.]